MCFRDKSPDLVSAVIPGVIPSPRILQVRLYEALTLTGPFYNPINVLCLLVISTRIRRKKALPARFDLTRYIFFSVRKAYLYLLGYFKVLLTVSGLVTSKSEIGQNKESIAVKWPKARLGGDTII